MATLLRPNPQPSGRNIRARSQEAPRTSPGVGTPDLCLLPFSLAVTFDHFQILRAIGKGSFGKVSTTGLPECHPQTPKARRRWRPPARVCASALLWVAGHRRGLSDGRDGVHQVRDEKGSLAASLGCARISFWKSDHPGSPGLGELRRPLFQGR